MTVSTVVPVAHAETSEADRATARALAEEGHKALAAKDYALAEDRFRRADALIRAPSLMVDHARALVGLGRLAEAYEDFDAARKEKLAPGAPPAFKRAVAEAERAIKEIAPKIAWVTLRVNGPSDPLIKIGEREIPASALGAPLPVDVGAQTIQVSAEGYVPKDAPLSLAAGQKTELELTLEPVPVAPPAPPPAPVIKHVVRRQPPPPVESKPSALTYIAFGVGGAGLAVGAVTGILCLSERSKLSSECPDGKCAPGTHHDDIARYHLYSYTSAIGLLVGVAGAGTGVALLLTKPKHEEPHAKARVTPYVGLGSVGVEGKF
ncbi:MAG TPA: hypothetical protein VFQ61_27745 [Polyangiaceae bacterium]|nr:hypothetical protein [Polyangiaceae bacterium]